MQRKDIIRYITVFLITLTLFLTATWLSSFLNDRKLGEVRAIQDKISIDILSSETQFQLLQELSCKDVSATSLSTELNDLAKKIAFSEENIRSNSEQVTELKKYYSLLQIKDYLLVQQIRSKCNVSVIPIFYFYTTEENCSDCVKQSAVLTELRKDYPELRIYSFDYNLNLSALQSLIKIFKVEDTKLPAVYMNDRLYTGFQSIESIEKAIPELKKLKAAHEKAAAEAKAAEQKAKAEN